jgi:hypothetical protein
MADSGKREQTDVDDQFRSLMEGLRTTLPGVQVLFAFLLVLPLQAEFTGISDGEKVAYYVAFFGSAMASVLLIAPSAHQRLRAPITGLERRSERHIDVAVNLGIAGTIIFAIALAAAVYLISSLTLTNSFAIAATVAVGAITVWSWFYLPLIAFRRS